MRTSPSACSAPRVQRHPRARQLVELRPRRRTGEHRPHARPHGLGRVGVGAAGTEHHRAVAQRVRGADDGAHVAGVVHAVQVGREVPAGSREPAPVDADHPRAGPQRADLVQQLGLDVLARDQQHLGLQARGLGGLDQVLALGREQVELVPPAPVGQLADGLEVWVVGGGDHGVRNKKGRLAGRPGRSCVCLVDQAAAASRARSAKRRKVSGSRTAMSASTLRSSSTPATLRPCMKVA